MRAVRQAGFNDKTFSNLVDMILVTEPEAAALYTARHLKEDKNTEFLKVSRPNMRLLLFDSNLTH